VDALVEFEPGFVPGLAFFSMEAELSALVGLPHVLDAALKAVTLTAGRV
jgi:predicted nucleotidyltransferase